MKLGKTASGLVTVQKDEDLTVVGGELIVPEGAGKLTTPAPKTLEVVVKEETPSVITDVHGKPLSSS